ncbi:MAG: hypothetical protein HFH14_01320 [Lachnospiraceae bacterium]|nr:hypothetical protein [Lachnospiraceae bacterium]
MSEDNNFNSENVAGNEKSVDNNIVTQSENIAGNEAFSTTNYAAGSFGNAAGSFNDGNKPKRNMKPVIAVVAMLAVIAMAAGVFLFSKSALGKNGHIITALRNTFAATVEEDGTAKLDKLLEAGKCAIDMQLSLDGIELAIACDMDRPQKQMSLSGSWSDGSTNMSAIATIDDTYFKCSIPEYINGVFEYNFTAENTGYFVDLITQSTGMDIAEFNKMFSDCFNMTQSQQKFGEDEYTKMLLDDFNELDFEKVDEKEFLVAGETKGCKGYKTVITKDIVGKWIDNYKELEIVNAATRSNLDIIKRSLADFGECIVTVYIADEKVAAIEMEVENDVLSVKFEGKENPLYNIVLSATDSGENEEVRIDTTKENGETKIVVTVAGEELITMSYNSETGKFSANSVDEIFVFEGTYKIDENGLELVIDNLSVDGESLSGMFKISDEVSIETIDAALPVLDIGNATEQQLQTFFMNNMNMQALYGLDGLTDSEDDDYDYYDYYDDYDLEGLDEYDLEDLEGLDI